MTSTKIKQWFREREKHLYSFCDLMNPRKTYLCDLGDILSRPKLKLWVKHVDPKTLRCKGRIGSWGNKIEREVFLSKIKDGMQLIR